jgi:sec-independent protein translocase protein TatB
MIQNFGGGEILVIIILALVVLGPDRLPEMARSAGRMLHKVRTMTAGLQDQVKDVMEDPAMQPLRELGEIAARPRQKLSEYALEAEAEERARKEKTSLDASAQAAEIIAAAEAAELAEATAAAPDADVDAAADGQDAVASDAATPDDTPDSASPVSAPPDTTPADEVLPPTAAEPEVVAPARAVPIEATGALEGTATADAGTPTEVDPVEPASHETA